MTNGQDVYAYHWPNGNRERIIVIVHAGAFQDKKGLEGTAHLLEHLIGYHGKNEGLKENFQAISFNGGSKRLSTSYFSTTFSWYGPTNSNSLKELLNTVGNCILDFPTNDDLLKKEKGIVQGEFRNRNPTKTGTEIVMREKQILSSGTGMERWIIPLGGLSETIERISMADLSDFHRQYCTPANISIVAVGGTPVEDVFNEVEKSIFSTTGGYRVKPIEPISKFPALKENFYTHDISKILKDTSSLHGAYFRISAVLPGTINNSTISICKDLIRAVIDEEIRERNNWSYGCSTCWETLIAMHYVSLQFNDLPLDKLNQTIEMVKHINIKENLFDEIKQQRVKRLSLFDSSIDELANDTADDISQNQNFSTIAEDIKQMEGITFDDIKEVFKHLSADRLWILVQKR